MTHSKDKEENIQNYLDYYYRNCSGKESVSSEAAVDYFFSNSICGPHQFSYILNVATQSLERIIGLEHFLGYDEADFDLMKLHQVIHSDDVEKMMSATDEAFAHLLEKGEAYPLAAQLCISYRIRHADGHWLHVQELGSILSVGDNGMPIKGLYTCIDISQISFSKVTAHLSCPCNGFRDFKCLKESIPDYGFTKREREVIQLLGTGASSEEIGKKLCISKHTVDKHRSNILKKAGAQRTGKLLSLFHDDGAGEQ